MRTLIAIVGIVFSIGVSASGAKFCGMFDLSKMNNEEIENIVTIDTLGVVTNPLVQCGLPGEKLAICQSCADSTAEESMRIIRPMLASEGHVLWHAAWHNLRRSKELLSEKEFEKAKSSGYIPAIMTYEEFVKVHMVGGSLSGEDFLAMHRLMMKMVQISLSESHLPCFAPWHDVPAMDDYSWPLPRPLTTAAQREAATMEWNLVQTQLKKIRNPVLLKNITLNRLGQLIEPNLHQNLHHLYQSVPVCSSEAKSQGYCDDLIPVETSPLNKHFWKLHGLIDDLIGDWLTVHGYDEISNNCNGRRNCYQWGAVWSTPASQKH